MSAPSHDYVVGWEGAGLQPEETGALTAKEFLLRSKTVDPPTGFPSTISNYTDSAP